MRATASAGPAPISCARSTTAPAATVLEAGLSYPVIRSREKNLTVTGLGFATNDDSYKLGDLFTRDRLRGFRLKADADWADSFLGINQVNVTFSQGIHGLGSTDNDNPTASLRRLDQCGPRRLQQDRGHVQPAAAAVLRISRRSSPPMAQYAFTPLLVSEQCCYGGRFFGRAFDPSQMLGDHCWTALGELRYDIPTGIKQLTRAQLYAYADHGEVYNIDPAAGTPRRSTAPRPAAACAPSGMASTARTFRSPKPSKARATTGACS